ncbi:hypothetical protein PVAND_007243 [Polypedilum vanderplanki]|uniref:Bardet-Biedl syndrome 4 protein-like protein n=1 Tax=Polypedilum vanderplanki TaxID=319348 RepID=A0A9J6C6D2_POLVA|nr:hypothetical protein PVAND_007243 [Polypedilum vanderplanki]
MNSFHFATNGNTTPTTSNNIVEKLKPKIKEMNSNGNNINWLLHKMYLIEEFDFCKKLIEEQLENSYDQEFLILMKGKILRDEGKYNEALSCFKRTIEFDSKNARNYKEIGKTLFKMGKLSQSLEIFLKAESCLEAPDFEIYQAIGELLRLNTKHSKANLLDIKEYFRRSIMCGKQIQTYKTLASIFRKEKDYVKAIELLESSLNVAPGSVEILSGLGILYLKINEVDRAYDKLIEAIQIDPKHTNSLLAIGAIQQTRNEIDLALNTYRNIRDIQDEGFEIWSNVGLCFYRKNKLISAMACLKKSLWLNQLNYNVLYNLGVVYITANQFASAFQCFVSAVSLRSDSAESFMMLAICLYYLNDNENAQIAFRKSILSSDAIKNPLIYLNYSIFSLECLKNIDEAQQYLNNFYNLCETMNVPSDYIQIAENVLSKLPSSMLMPETRHLHQIKETNISTLENIGTHNNSQHQDEHVNEEEDTKSTTADDEMV